MDFDFDSKLDRRNSESVKWLAYDEDVIPMWVADMDFKSPQVVIDALHKRVEHGVFGYPIETWEMKAAVKNWLKTRYKWDVSEDSIIFLPGVVNGFNLATHAFAGRGKEVLYQVPAYPPFLYVAKNSASINQEVDLVRKADNTYEIDFEVFNSKVGKDTGLFLFCNPQNPTGRVFREDELLKIAEICLKNHTIICSDEIHADFVYNGHRHIPIASLSPEIAMNTVTLLAPSKTFNIAGLGSSIAIVENAELKKKLEETTGGLVGSPNVLGLTATLAAYSLGAPWLDTLNLYLESNRDFLLDFIQKKLPGIEVGKPEGTFLGWLDCRGAVQGTAYEFFLKNARVALNDGARFGACGEGFVRINFGCPRAQLEEALNRMAKALEEHR